MQKIRPVLETYGGETIIPDGVCYLKCEHKNMSYANFFHYSKF